MVRKVNESGVEEEVDVMRKLQIKDTGEGGRMRRAELYVGE